MPTNRTKRTRSRSGSIDHWKLDDLVTGDCCLGAGYTPPGNRNGCSHWTKEDWAAVHGAMRADWAANGRAVMAWWRGENEFWTHWQSGGENQRDKLRETLAGRGQSEPFAFREWGEPA